MLDANGLPPLRALIGLGRVADLVGVDPATAWRWATRGVALPDGGRLRLTTWILPGRRVTTEDAVRTFIELLTAARGGQTAPAVPRSPSRRQREIERADAQLESMGV